MISLCVLVLCQIEMLTKKLCIDVSMGNPGYAYREKFTGAT